MTNLPAKSINRRAFVQGSTLWLLGTASSRIPARGCADQEVASGRVRVGMVTDLHYADKPPAGSRHYRETLEKLAEAAEQFVEDQPDFLVELGDFIDAADSVAAEKRYLKRIHQEFTAIPGPKYYVLGNHCVDTLTKEEFLGGIGRQDSYYSFDVGPYHFIVLDSCFRSDGIAYGRRNFHWTDPNIPPEQLRWLEDDLKNADRPTIVFAHQRLDVDNHYAVKNAAAVRRVLEDSGQVQAVFQGHSHRNDYRLIGGIHYCTLVAMVEGSGEQNNGYCTMDLQPDGTIRLAGFRQQESYRWDGR